ncbi:NADH-quinone oxidoreductase subunit C [Arachnia propionica]|uniref:NADH-quinone oxidoreductase subunit C n=1 Tax=Arachnia propionica TaxID=1750 RepID=A0A3P1T9F3_9ACTN|nr:NADH-quinone oxidoreductase subunit C [Arachnia propionica]RRD05960.1 NADH-quinone oxidoreductase subunit C [Arachnia propionica]
MAETVAVADWHDRVEQARRDGYDFLINLTAVDEIGRSPHIRVLLWLRNRNHETLTLAAMCDRDDPHLPDITDLFAGAAWLQRQVHDFFGVVFDGADDSPLLNRTGGTPLRKDVLLTPRITTRWPGGLEPGETQASPGRRRLVPPGVPDATVLADPEATAETIAQSAAGVRMGRAR